jgi:hypothetical protein
MQRRSSSCGVMNLHCRCLSCKLEDGVAVGDADLMYPSCNASLHSIPRCPPSTVCRTSCPGAAAAVSVRHCTRLSWTFACVLALLSCAQVKIERIISLLSTSPEGEVRCRCQNGMAYKD